jgi:hypothetical protein
VSELQIVRIYEGQPLRGVEVVRILSTEEVTTNGYAVRLRLYDVLVRETIAGAAEEITYRARQRVS